MVKVFCDMCGREIDYEVDGVNLDFNHYGVVNFKTPFSAEKQLCLSCAARVCNFVENGAREEGLSMRDEDLLAALRRLKVQTGSLVCLGCGHEHNCGIHGCAILRKTIAWLERKLAEDKSRSVMEYRDGR